MTIGHPGGHRATLGRPTHDLAAARHSCSTSSRRRAILPGVGQIRRRIREISENVLRIYNTIGCRHYARVDLRLNEKDEFYFLEINTLPGMTPTSLLPKAAKAAG